MLCSVRSRPTGSGARIKANPRFTPTADDLVPDPDHPGRPMWHSRVYRARRHLGKDDIVSSERGQWGLSDAARTTTEPRTPLQPSVIAAPCSTPRCDRG